MRWRAALLGMVMMAAPGVPAAMLLSAPPVPQDWPVSPAEPLVKAPARWDEPANASLALLRRVSASEARRSGVLLAACEARAGRVTGTHRNARFRRCATRPLARTDGFAGANGRMLIALASNGGPTRACRERVLMLSGMTTSLAFSARATLRGGLDLPWAELVVASRSIRTLAGEVLRLARAPGWRTTCRARRPAPPAPERTA